MEELLSRNNTLIILELLEKSQRKGIVLPKNSIQGFVGMGIVSDSET